ncbi:MAG TPA: hypothetical protein VOA87_18375 [Thermoanaerobaculia bacterium]|nr:hypothetical protein [Thermoanaerobaculia bacterium]
MAGRPAALASPAARAVLLALLLILPTATPAAAASGAERLRAAGLAAELEAARGHQLYLVLDPFVPALDLKVDGIRLRRFAIESALFGRSRLAGGDLAWPAFGYTLVSQLQEPERPKIPIQTPEPSPPAAAARPGPPSVLPTPVASTPAFSAAREEALGQTPTHYRLRFAPLLDISILGEAGVANLPGRLWRTRHRLIEGWEALALRLRGQPVPPRVVLYMTPDEARRLFLTLLPKMRLVLHPRDPVARK